MASSVVSNYVVENSRARFDIRGLECRTS